MQKTISATEARVHFGDVLDQVEQADFRFMIERRGKPVAAIISLSELEKIGAVEFDAEALIERARRNREATATWRNGEPFPDVVEMLNEGREERHGQFLDNLYSISEAQQ